MRDRWRAAVRLANARLQVARFPRVREKSPHGLPGELIVSLTSYPPRFPTLSLTLRSLLDQKVKADRTILWIAHDDFDQIPPEARRLERFGLEVRRCKDWRSYKKLVPALTAFPEAFIVTADDDLYYPPDWLAELAAEARQYPGAIIAHRAHLTASDESGKLAPYREWEFETNAVVDGGPGERIFPTGAGGVLYPPRALDSRATDAEAFIRLCPAADDVWFFSMALLNGTPRKRIAAGRPLVLWHGSQEVALFHDNWLGSGNDEQIQAVQNDFGSLPDCNAA